MRGCLFNLLLAVPLALPASEPSLDRALLQAAKTGQAGAAKSLLEMGARVDTRTVNGLTPLMFAAQSGQMDLLRVILSQRPDVNAHSAAGFTAVMLAAANGQTAALNLLLAAGADPWIADQNRRTAFDHATVSGQKAAVIVLKSRTELSTRLLDAASRGDTAAVQELLRRGAPAEAGDWLALRAAAANGHIQTIRALLAWLGRKQRIPLGPALESAVEAGQAGTLKLLLALHPSPDEIRQTFLAGQKYRREALIGTQEPLANLRSRFERAVLDGSVDRVLEGLRDGIPVDLRLGGGRTALMTAVQIGNLEMVRVLAEHGANLYLRDNPGEKALDIAKAGQPAIAGYLETRMSSGERVRKRAAAAKTLEEFIQQKPAVPELLNGISDFLADLPAAYRASESARRAQAAVEELRRRVVEQWNPLEPTPPDYGNSLAADFWALKELGEPVPRNESKKDPRKAKAERALELDNVSRTILAVAEDLEIKLETCKQAGRGLGGRINVRVNTRRGATEVKGLQVFFVAKIFESQAEENAEPFPRFSSPTQNQLPPGRYIFWARDPVTNRKGERMIVRASGTEEIGVDLPVPQ